MRDKGQPTVNRAIQWTSRHLNDQKQGKEDLEK